MRTEITIQSFATAVGVSPRQIDYWFKKGYLRGENPGTGRRWQIEESEVGVARRIKSLILFGFTPARAAEIVRLSSRDKLVVATEAMRLIRL